MQGTKRPVVIAATWSGNEIAIIRRQHRKDIYELLLAHAPDEFGGEAIGGEAVLVDPTTLRERPYPGLEGRQVRVLVSPP